MICNLADLDGFVQREILDRFDHAESEHAAGICRQQFRLPKILCIVIYDILQRGFHSAHLEKVRFEETMMNSFEYAGTGEPRR